MIQAFLAIKFGELNSCHPRTTITRRLPLEYYFKVDWRGQKTRELHCEWKRRNNNYKDTWPNMDRKIYLTAKNHWKAWCLFRFKVRESGPVRITRFPDLISCKWCYIMFSVFHCMQWVSIQLSNWAHNPITMVNWSSFKPHGQEPTTFLFTTLYFWHTQRSTTNVLRSGHTYWHCPFVIVDRHVILGSFINGPFEHLSG